MLRFVKYLLIFFFSNFLVLLHGQAISIGIGPIHQHTKPITPILNGTNSAKYNTDNLRLLSYEHFIPKSKISLLLFYSKYDGNTEIGFDIGGATNGNGEVISQIGFTGVHINTLSVGAAYNLLAKNRKPYIKPSISIGVQTSKPNGDKVWDGFPIMGPDYVETGISSTSLKTAQIVPSIGINTGIVLWKRIDIRLSIQGILGHKDYQKLFYSYEYKGVPQETGEYASNGTGWFYTIGVGYQFAKLIK